MSEGITLFIMAFKVLESNAFTEAQDNPFTDHMTVNL